MTKKKTPQTIEECNAELELTQKKIRQYENRSKMLDRRLAIEKRKERNHRLYSRGGYSIRAGQDDVAGFLKPVAGLRCRHTPCPAFSHRRHRMAENTTPTKEPKEIPAGLLNMRVGNTTYIVGVHFSKESKDTLEDKVKRLMCDDVRAANFQSENYL